MSDGDQIEAGDLVLVLEAMKMEQPIAAHKAGVVKGLTATVGQVVASGAVLCEIITSGQAADGSSPDEITPTA